MWIKKSHQNKVLHLWKLCAYCIHMMFVLIWFFCANSWIVCPSLNHWNCALPTYKSRAQSRWTEREKRPKPHFFPANSHAILTHFFFTGFCIIYNWFIKNFELFTKCIGNIQIYELNVYFTGIYRNYYCFFRNFFLHSLYLLTFQDYFIML